MTYSLSTPFPVLSLLNPRRYGLFMLIALLIGSLIGAWAWLQFSYPKWAITAIIVAVWLPVAIWRWRTALSEQGFTLTLLDIVLTTQALHTIEHIAQWIQYYTLNWTLRQSNGLLSPLNAEWVHFVWNWLVVVAVLLLMRGGIRNGWAWGLLIIACLHTFEHSYLFLRYQLILGDLRELGVSGVTAQGLPGLLGRDGWLSRSPLTQNSFLCTLPGLTTASRLDVHFWWNVIEMSLLALAAHVHLRKQQWGNQQWSWASSAP